MGMTGDRVMVPKCAPTHLRARTHEVRTIPLKLLRDRVAEWHYAGGSSNTATYRHGLFRRGGERCLGVAQWLPPTKGAAIKVYPEGEWRRVLSLSRLAIDPNMPTNAASFLLGRSIRLIRQDGRFDCLVTYADDSQGHEGTIYYATNWEYTGKTVAEARWVDGTGRQVARLATKSRTKKEMETMGYRVDGKYAKHRFRMVLR